MRTPKNNATCAGRMRGSGPLGFSHHLTQDSWVISNEEWVQPSCLVDETLTVKKIALSFKIHQVGAGIRHRRERPRRSGSRFSFSANRLYPRTLRHTNTPGMYHP
jgi:hypothetical protein